MSDLSTDATPAGARTRSQPASPPTYVSLTELGRWIDLSRKLLREIRAQGVITQGPQRVALQPNIVAYVRH